MVRLASILFVAAGHIWPTSVIGQPLTSRTLTVSSGTRSIHAIGFASTAAMPNPVALAAGACPLDLPPALRPLVEQMWRASPTFRRQCGQLADRGATVVVRLDPRLDAGPTKAATAIYARDGVVRARTRLGVVEAEYLAHEIEHVLERIDGVDLQLAVRHRLDGATQNVAGAFETARATAIGRLVAQEVRRKER